MIDYFDNEKGDVTITLYDEPIAICKNKQSAEKLISAYKSLTMRVDELSKRAYILAQAGEAVKREMLLLYDDKLGFDNIGTKVVKLLSLGGDWDLRNGC